MTLRHSSLLTFTLSVVLRRLERAAHCFVFASLRHGEGWHPAGHRPSRAPQQRPQCRGGLYFWQVSSHTPLSLPFRCPNKHLCLLLKETCKCQGWTVIHLMEQTVEISQLYIMCVKNSAWFKCVHFIFTYNSYVFVQSSAVFFSGGKMHTINFMKNFMANSKTWNWQIFKYVFSHNM